MCYTAKWERYEEELRRRRFPALSEHTAHQHLDVVTHIDAPYICMVRWKSHGISMIDWIASYWYLN